MSKEPVTYTETADSVTVTITGEAFNNLKRMADALNRCDWGDEDNTPATVADNFIIGEWLYKLTEPSSKYGRIINGGVGESADGILDCIDTGFRDGTPEHRARIDALRREFEAVGLYDE